MSVLSNWTARLKKAQGGLVYWRNQLKKAIPGTRARTHANSMANIRKRQVDRARKVIARHSNKKIDAGALRTVAPWLTPSQAKTLALALGPAFSRYGITTPRRAAAAVAQMCEESAGFHTTTEYASGAEYEGRRDLGNIHVGDGVRFKGRGYIQITGRANYAAVSKAFGVDFIAHPDQLASPKYAALASCWWWQNHGCNQIADSGDFVALTRRINGGTNGLATRQAYYGKALRVASQLVPR